MAELVGIARLTASMADAGGDLVLDRDRITEVLTALGLREGGSRGGIEELLLDVLSERLDEPLSIRSGRWSIRVSVRLFQSVLASALLVGALEAAGVDRTPVVVLAALVPFVFDLEEVRVDPDEGLVLAFLRHALASREDRRHLWADLPEHLRHELTYLDFIELLERLDRCGALSHADEHEPAVSPSAPGSFRQRLGRRRPAGDVGASRGTDERALRIAALCDEWFPARGGLSAFNRYLCAALAGAGAEVFCVVPSASPEEREDAAASGVRLIDALAIPGGSERDALMRRLPLPAGIVPDVIIGHGRVTGPAAKVQAEDHFPQVVRLHFVHMEPDRIEWHKPGRDDDVGARAEDRTQTELDLGRGAARAVAIGPRLHRWLVRDMSVYPGVPRPLRLDPGFDGAEQEERTPPPGEPQVLLLGRLEDARIKGLDIAARAIGHALDLRGPREPKVELLVRGSSPGQALALWEAILAWVGQRSSPVTVRNYSTDFDRLRRDLRRASLVLMPSRAEGFGLVGLEAIVAGTPALISEESGLGMLLREVLSEEQAARVVVPVTGDDDRDARRWGHLVAAVLRDRRAAFVDAGAARRVLAAARRWPMTAAQLIDEIRECREHLSADGVAFDDHTAG